MPPLSVMIKPVSGLCNMQCHYCFYVDEMHNRKQSIYPKMSIEMLKTVVRKVMACAEVSVSFAFQGGEPTLIGLPFFEALVKFQKQYNTQKLKIYNAVQTNGYDLPDEMLRFFAKEKFLLGVSLDGIKETHDALRPDRQGRPTYQRIWETTQKMRKFGVEFNILCVVNAYVAKRPKEVFDTLAPFSYLQFIACLDKLDGSTRLYSLTPELYTNFLKTTFDLYYEYFMKGQMISVRNFDNYVGIILGMPPENCSMGGRCSSYLLIEGDGSVFPCDFYVLDQWKLGNIQTDSLRRLLKSDLARVFIEESMLVPDKCRACLWYFLCRNGCKRERGVDGLNRWCECFSEFFEYSIDRMKKIAQTIATKEKEYR
jgi:uncharacterized protein